MTPTRNIDFATLTMKDALDLAILIEEEAYDRYSELADQLSQHDTPEAARFFRFMMANEEKHRAALAERRGVMFADASCGVTRAMIFDVEAPDYDEVRAFMTLRQALETALRAEQKAHAFFVAALAHVADPTVRTLFEELAAEEVTHQDLVRRELDKAPPDPAIATDEFADDPAGE
ncbi:MAG: ferritin family protein [Deltaproteobacteria bacterium]|nr:ferritin family protein [Deltaproteobacteria bacterium]